MITDINKVPAGAGKINLMMAARTLFAKTHWILTYRQRRRKERLYLQWVNHAGLPPRITPPEAG
jgi:hypothetical protein